MNKCVIECTQVTKCYENGVITPVLKGIDFALSEGQSAAIVGASGSGKSTLLQILGGLDSPTQGRVVVMGEEIHKLSAKASGLLRNQHLGFVYQFHHLLAEFTATENVAMPLLVSGVTPAMAQEKAVSLLGRVGLGHRLAHTPGELSGGERQRAALARALVTHPSCVMADEPTGNLDSHTASQVFDLLLELKQDLKIAFIIVTHDATLAEKMDFTFHLEDGVLNRV